MVAEEVAGFEGAEEELAGFEKRAVVEKLAEGEGVLVDLLAENVLPDDH